MRSPNPFITHGANDPDFRNTSLFGQEKKAAHPTETDEPHFSLSKKSLFLLGESGDFFDKLRNRLCLVDKGGFFSGAGEET